MKSLRVYTALLITLLLSFSFAEQKGNEKLNLTVVIAKESITIGAKGGFLPSLFYKKGSPAKVGKSTYYLYDQDLTKEVQAVYNSKKHLMLDKRFNPISDIKIGDTVFTATIPRGRVIVKSISDYSIEPLSLVNGLSTKLYNIKAKYEKKATDTDTIIIAVNSESDFNLPIVKEIKKMLKEIGFTTIKQALTR